MDDQLKRVDLARNGESGNCGFIVFAEPLLHLFPRRRSLNVDLLSSFDGHSFVENLSLKYSCF